MVAWSGRNWNSKDADTAWWTAAAEQPDGLRIGKILQARRRLALGNYRRPAVLDTTIERILSKLASSS